nr:hypothetical protein [uncultured Rhodopila sp.]
MVTASPLVVDARRYFRLGTPNRIASTLRIGLSEHCFVPSLDDLDSDWLASVAAPAFHILARTRPAARRQSFLSIGTGCGLDALGAVEILGSGIIAVTDVFADIVAAARSNIVTNLAEGTTIALTAATGDLLGPLAGGKPRFDVVYENLPNTPIAEPARLADRQTAAGYLGSRSEAMPAFVRQRLLELHYLTLQQVRPMLNPGGAVLSTIGARIPLASFFDLTASSGYAARLLTYGWKKQAGPDEYIPGYVAMEREGLGPFHFYRVADVQAAFAGLDPEQAGREALDIEADLAAKRLTATEALALHGSGTGIAHTFVALLSEPA